MWSLTSSSMMSILTSPPSHKILASSLLLYSLINLLGDVSSLQQLLPEQSKFIYIKHVLQDVCFYLHEFSEMFHKCFYSSSLRPQQPPNALLHNECHFPYETFQTILYSALNSSLSPLKAWYFCCKSLCIFLTFSHLIASLMLSPASCFSFNHTSNSFCT